MPSVPWESRASLMRVARLGVTEPEERLVARDTLQALVATVVEMAPDRQRGLLIRIEEPDLIAEYDDDGIRALADRSDYGSDGEPADEPDKPVTIILPTDLTLGDWRP